MDKPRIYVDFNEILEPNLVLLSQTGTEQDSSGSLVLLQEGKKVHVYMDDMSEDGKQDNLIADGHVEHHPGTAWGTAAIWCCRIDPRGIRHESDEKREAKG